MAEYHVNVSCNKCGGKNDLVNSSFDERGIYETETKCSECGFDDYWAYGHFESGQEMESHCKKYYNPPIN